jgi:hypothetical protein
MSSVRYCGKGGANVWGHGGCSSSPSDLSLCVGIWEIAAIPVKTKLLSVTDFPLRIPPRYKSHLKSHFSVGDYYVSNMARTDKSARIAAAIAAIQSGEITDYSKAAAKFSVDRTMISKRICGLTKLRRDANSF